MDNITRLLSHQCFLYLYMAFLFQKKKTEYQILMISYQKQIYFLGYSQESGG